MRLDGAALDGQAYALGEPGYEEARRATVWNARLPDRYPDLVVQAASERDVVAAVRHAAAHDLRVGVRSGGAVDDLAAHLLAHATCPGLVVRPPRPASDGRNPSGPLAGAARP